MQNKLITFILISLIVTTVGMGGVVVKEFRAEPGLNKVEVKWRVGAETGVKGYNLYRSLDGVSFTKLSFIMCKSSSEDEITYTFTDNSVFKADDRVYYYKLEFVNNDNSTSAYEEIIQSTPQISSARHTWGSIKAMFR